MHKQGSCFHDQKKKRNLLWSQKPFIYKNDTQMCKRRRKLNFLHVFGLTAINTWAMAFHVINKSRVNKNNLCCNLNTNLDLS